ncbi:hypothetical protein [Microvirga subterranea]|uniref:Uncharacterized protein n=1 Tax=Microvirga subterranea TaxID=186651 RepID=A0A370HKJ7_9HYPH|nr:hypothetical protein [Microvirga subterranea]RDI58665.1 hypothetical protein DES45_105188 [Microvirga subterranea]
MNIALFAIAAAMIVGGLLATFLGWDIVLVERGWTMVIAGSVFAASGALLLGIAAAVSRLTQIQAELNRLHASLSEEETLTRQPAPDLSSAALAGGLLGGAAGAGAATLAEPEQPPLPLFPEAAAPEHEREEPETLRREEPAPEPVVPPEPRIYPEPVREAEQAREEEEAPEVRLPDFLIAGRYRETREEIEESEIDEGLYAPGPIDEKVDLAATPAESGPVAGTEEEEPRGEELREPETPPEPIVEPAEEREPEQEPEASPEPERAEEPTTARAVIGTYNSGDNHYVMYSDGSIEAETPQGLFHFNSLDELKEFIASGGESNQGSSAT